MYAIRLADDVAETQIKELSDSEANILAEIFEVLRLAPENGIKLRSTGNMYVWDHEGISVTYFVLDPQREVGVIRVDRLPI